MAFSELVRVAQKLERVTQGCDDGWSGRDLRRKASKLVEALLRLGEGRRQLNRAWEHLIGCRAIYRMMFYRRAVSVADFYDAILLIGEIYCPLAEMRERPAKEWDRVEVTPMARAERPEDDPIIQMVLEERAEMEQRVDKGVKQTAPPVREQPTTTSSRKIEVVYAPPGQKRPPPRWLN